MADDRREQPEGQDGIEINDFPKDVVRVMFYFFEGKTNKKNTARCKDLLNQLRQVYLPYGFDLARPNLQEESSDG